MSKWTTTTIEELLDTSLVSKRKSIPTTEYLPSGRFPIIDQSASFVAGWTDDESAVITDGLPLVVFGDHTRTLKFVDSPFARGADGTQLLRTTPGIDTRFFYFACRFVDLPSRGYNRHFALLRQQELLVPEELNEQQQIAGALELVQKSVDGQGTALFHAEALKRAVVQELFTRGLRGGEPQHSEIGPIPEGWITEHLGDSHSISSGGTPARGIDEYWVGGTIPWVKTAEVNYCTITETSEHITQAGLDHSAAKVLPAGTVLIAMYGQGVTRGKVGILGIEATTNQACAAVQPKSAAVAPRFLYHLLAARYSELRSLAHGGQQQNLNLDIIRDFPISYPRDADQQQEIVDVLEALDAKIDLHRQKKALYAELFQALLHGLMSREINISDLDLSALRKPDAVPA